MDWGHILHKTSPTAHSGIVEEFAKNVPHCAAIAELNSPLRMAHFLAQCAEESDGFKTTVEYASGSKYEGRHDLGNVHPGDGVRYRGRGLIQLTGRVNYTLYGHVMGVNLCDNPDLAAKFPAAAEIAAYYWKFRHINHYADMDDVVRVTESVNGGTNGLRQRQWYLHTLKQLLGVKS